MRGWRAALAAAACMFVCLPAAAQSSGQGPEFPPPPRSIPTSPILAMRTGSITVSVKDQQGALIPAPSLSIDSNSPNGRTLGFLDREGEDWVFTNLVPGGQYVVEVQAPGFEREQQIVNLPDEGQASERIEFFLVPARNQPGFGRPGGDVILAPRAQREVQQAAKDLAARKIDSAQKHLAKALEMAPGNPLVNYLMGASWLQAGNPNNAIPYLEKAVSLDPRQTPALLALGAARFRQGDMAKAIQALKPAADAAPQTWETHWLLAAAYLRERDYQQASEQAASALKYGNGKADPAKLIQADALANLGKRDEALEAYTDYLNRYPNDPHANQIRSAIAELRQPLVPPLPAPAAPATNPAPAASAILTMSVPPPPPSLPAKESWAPLDVDSETPEVISGATCQLPQVLNRAGRHAVELVSNLEKFSATEEFQAVEIGRNGKLSQPIQQKFTYLVFIEHIGAHVLQLEEMRNPDAAGLLTGQPLAGKGLAGMALVFHPDIAGDFAWKCEGMGQWKGQPAWLVRFEQRADRPTSAFHAFVTPAEEFRLPLKGRAWVAANGDQVLHLETDLVKPMERLRLEREHFAIDYGLVSFHTHRVALWLPQAVDTYCRFRGHSYHQYSRFSNFELFWAGAGKQTIASPKQAAKKP